MDATSLNRSVLSFVFIVLNFCGASCSATMPRAPCHRAFAYAVPSACTDLFVGWFLTAFGFLLQGQLLREASPALTLQMCTQPLYHFPSPLHGSTCRPGIDHHLSS